MRSSYGHGDAAALERAKKRLEAFDFVGVTEGFDDSVRLLSRLIGLPGNPSAQRTNTAPESERAARADRYDAATLEGSRKRTGSTSSSTTTPGACSKSVTGKRSSRRLPSGPQGSP